MAVLAEASLSVDERTLLDRYLQKLRDRLGGELHGVWLFGSRARGEKPRDGSDIDLVVFVDDASWDARMGVRMIVDEVASDLGLNDLPWYFSVHVHTLAWLAQRREIRSFFVAELDRDKVVLYGHA